MAVTVQCPNPECGRTGSVPADHVGRTIRCSHCGERFTAGVAATVLAGSAASTAGAGSAAAEAADVPRQVGRYQVRARVGAGAFGAVYRAHDPQLDREVALKVPHPGALADPKAVERFLREARAAARLRHPSVVPLYDAGRDGDVSYLAAAFIDGHTLAEKTAEARLPFRRAAEVVRALAEGLAYAHKQGIVHRDVKPANVLLDAQGRPHLTDFGLAYRQGMAERLTQDGALLGTPAYMAPEQAAGPGGEPLPASDQYSLGAVLYELLCGRTPFSGPAEVVLANILRQDPAPPRRVNPNVPRDLETVCLKALARRPEQRYPSCQDLADDLRRWLESEPIKARRQGPAERVVRWCGRRPVLAGLGAVAAVALLAVAGVSTWSAVRLADYQQHLAEQRARAEAKAEEARGYAEDAERELTEAQAAAEQAEKARRAAARHRVDAEAANAQAEEDAQRARRNRDEAAKQEQAGRRQLYEDHLKLAALACRQGQFVRARELLQRYVPQRGQEHPRGADWHVLWNYAHGFRTLPGTNRSASLFSPDGKTLAMVGPAGVELWEVATIQKRSVLAGSTADTSSLRFTPDGKTLVSTGPGYVKLWDLATPRGANLNGASYLDLARDGRTLATRKVSYDEKLHGWTPHQEVQLWEVATGRALRTINGWGDAYFTSDGKELVTDGREPDRGAPDNPVRVWDVATGNQLGSFTGFAPQFSPDGRTLAIIARVLGVQPFEVELWDVATGKQRAAFPAAPALTNSRPAFSPDGKFVVLQDSPGFVSSPRVPSPRTYLWDAATGKAGPVCQGRFVGFTAGGRILVTQATQGEEVVKFWDAATGKAGAVFEGRFVAFRAGGKVLVTEGYKAVTSYLVTEVSKTVTFWNADTAKEILTLTPLPTAGGTVLLSPDGRILLAAEERIRLPSGKWNSPIVKLWGRPPGEGNDLAGK